MKLLVLTLSLIVCGGCTLFKKSSPSDPLVIDRFETSVAATKANTAFEFIVQATDGAKCAIEPTVGDVSCSGRKAWAVPTAGLYTFTLIATKDGTNVRQSVAITITP